MTWKGARPVLGHALLLARRWRYRFLSWRSALEGERKQVTVLFADVSGVTSLSEQLDPEDVHALMNRAFELMLNEVHRYEGTVNQFLGDGIMALFGAPIAHEDHAQRAVHAALGIQKALAAYEEDLKRRRGITFQVRQGLNTGLVVVGSIATDLRMDYTAVGDTTNVAARLEHAADAGRIVISAATHRLVAGYFYTRPLGELVLKGKAEPVPAWEVIGSRVLRMRLEVEAERGLTPYVGRERELTLLMRSYHSRIALTALSSEDSRAMARAVLGAATLPDDLGRLIVGKAEGNPFFVEEVTKALLEGGAIRREGDGYVLARPLDEIVVPDTIQDVIMARIDRLEETSKKTLQLASVIGREFTRRLLERVGDIRGRTEEFLRELKAIERIYEKTAFPELAYMFKHALTHDVAYHSLLVQRRKELHRLIGFAIEELYGDRLAEHYEVLAYHFARGEEWAKALHYLREAGAKAAARSAFPEAVSHLEGALVALEHLPESRARVEQAVDLRFALRNVLVPLGEYGRIHEILREAEELAEGLGDERRLGRVTAYGGVPSPVEKRSGALFR